MTVRLLRGDCRVTLATLEPGSVQSVCTSPPFYGLRSYGTPDLVWGGDAEHAHYWQDLGTRTKGGVGQNKGLANGADSLAAIDGQQTVPLGSFCPCGAWRGSLGLEPTPELFVEHIVECFRAVKRVLRDDGVVFCNLGDSYSGSGKGPTGQNGIGDQSVRQGFVGSPRVPAYGSDGTAPTGSTGLDSSYSDLCDECRGVLSNRTADMLPHHPAGFLRQSPIDRDSATLDSVAASLGGAAPDAPESTTPRSSLQPPAECSHCSNCGACLSVLHSYSRDARLCARKFCEGEGLPCCTPSSASPCEQPGRCNRHIATVSPYLQPQYTAPYKAKDLMEIPSMVAQALRADGWYLRSRIPWLKRNAMPESVTDRPATSVEYVFLLSKSSRYYWDADAVRMPNAVNPNWNYGSEAYRKPTNQDDQKTDGDFRKPKSAGPGWHGFGPAGPNGNGRNLRNGDFWFQTWQGLLLDEDDAPLALVVNPAPLKIAHYASFPPKLVEPMVKASSRPGDWVLDHFAGSGTTLMVADRLGRNAIGCELSESYSDMGTARVVGDSPMFTEMTS